jgi:hypothetical protein
MKSSRLGESEGLLSIIEKSSLNTLIQWRMKSMEVGHLRTK